MLDCFLQSVKDLMDIMKDKDALINVRNRNHQRLLEELSSLVVSSVLFAKHKWSFWLLRNVSKWMIMDRKIM